ncbi:MAG: hypothetical protein ACLQM8_07855 [Limisphaerales bacterium]
MKLKYPSSKTSGSGGLLMFLLLAAVMVLLLGGGCLPGRTFFSNDGPLGRRMAACHHLPERFTGCWEDLNSIGYRDLAAVPSVSYGLLCVLGPFWFSRFYMPLALLLLGLSAWGCFRRLGLAQPACILGGLAAALNSAFFSAACWGSAAHAITVAMGFLALAALADPSPKGRWSRAALAGLALGMAVTEGADIGAIFSVFVAGFVVYQACVAEGPRARNIALGVSRVAVAAVFAGALAAQPITELLVTDVEGVVGTSEHGGQTKQGHWDWATQWSLPKSEALGLVVPGLFGYRVDAQGGASYWGTTGQDAAWARYLAGDRQGPPPSGFLRFVGGGNYTGVPVVLLALWAAAQSLRRKNSAFDAGRRRLLWFWLGVAVISLLLAFGRYGPFYRWLYALPYLSKFRNPVKFIHVFSFATIVLFAYGVDSLWKRYMRPPGMLPSYRWAGFASWWRKATGLERRWAQGCLAVLGLSLVAWGLYNNAQPALEHYLQSAEFDAKAVPAIADFSIRQVGWFELFFTLTAGLMVLILSGVFTGKRAVWGAIWLGLVLVVDLGRANQPWVCIWDYENKYATNPIVDLLRQRPYEHRAADMPREFLEREFQRAYHKKDPGAQTDYLLYQVYSREWAQHLFTYYNIQSLDIVQLPRKPSDLKAFEEALKPSTDTNSPALKESVDGTASGAAVTPNSEADNSRLVFRRWQLTNTRYVLGSMHFLDYFDRQLAPGRHRLRVVERFKLVPKSGVAGGRMLTTADVTAKPAPDGPFALFEFTGALPRARLYGRWQVTTNNPAALSQLRPGLGSTLTELGVAPSDQAALSELASPSFDPEQCVLVADSLPAAAPGASPSQDAGTVEFVSYAPKDIVLKANALAPSVLLLNDRFEQDWNVRVDGQPAKLLRCNYIMRGVYLTPGAHRVEFRFQPPIGMLYVSLAVLGCGLLLLSFVTVSNWRSRASLPPVAAGSRPPGSRGQGTRKDRRNGGPAPGARAAGKS